VSPGRLSGVGSEVVLPAPGERPPGRPAPGTDEPASSDDSPSIVGDPSPVQPPAPPTPRPPRTEAEQIRQAAREKKAWHVIYHAKRSMQTNPWDSDAYNGLISLDPRNLACFDEVRKEETINPFTRFMDECTLIKFVRESDLVERDAGDILCRYKDRGETMFLI